MLIYRLLVAIHVFADMLWIGSIVAAGALITTKDTAELSARAPTSRWVYLRLASPAFGVAFIAGIAALVVSHSVLRLPSMHAKLTLAIGVIGIHHWIGAKTRQLTSGSRRVGIGILPVALLVLAAGGAAVLGVLKPF